MAAFVLSAFVLAMLPGPATALLIRETISGDRRRVVGVIAGIEVGIFAWALLSAVGPGRGERAGLHRPARRRRRDPRAPRPSNAVVRAEPPP